MSTKVIAMLAVLALAAPALADLEHRRIAYMEFSTGGPGLRHYSETDRRAGYETAMREAGLPSSLLGPIANDAGAGELNLAMKWMSQPDHPTAFVSYSYGAALQHAAALVGLRMPEDVSVVSFVDKSTRSLGRPETNVVVPSGIIGQEAVTMLLAKLQAPQKTLSPVVVPEYLVQGATAASPLTERERSGPLAN